MSSTPIDFDNDPVGNRVFDETTTCLQQYLQPQSAETLESITGKILDLLPEGATNSHDMGDFDIAVILIGEQIPYAHSSQVKLTRLMENLGHYGRFVSSDPFGRMRVFQSLGGELRDRIGGKSFTRCFQGCCSQTLRAGWDEDHPDRYISFMAFAALLHAHGILEAEPTWAIWSLREAHEDREREADPSACVLAAAQWIRWWGQGLFQQVLCPEPRDTTRKKAWYAGPRWTGDADLTIQRWRFWRDEFRTIANGTWDGEHIYTEECKTVSAKTAGIMQALEDGMMP